MDSVLSEYQASLAELTFNSKPHINMLTVLAKENVNYASDIVKIIETQLFKVSLKKKLPVLYLIDSIVKNFGGQYMKLFSYQLIPLFLCIFQKADGKTRTDLYKLRSTWDSIFPTLLLKQLDSAVRDFDSNWPLRSKKRTRSRNPLALGLPSASPTAKFSEEENETKYGEDRRLSLDQMLIHTRQSSNIPVDLPRSSTEHEVEEVIEEEELEMDEESLGALEMLEEKLRKRQAELSRLEKLESKSVTPTFNSPKMKDPEPEAVDSDDDCLKIDLNDYPVIPVENTSYVPDEEVKAEVEAKDENHSLDEDLSDTKHWISSRSNFEPNVDQVKSHTFDGMTTNRVISHFTESKQEIPVKEEKVDVKEEPLKSTLTKCDGSSQTDATSMTESTAQIAIESKDESTQYRYRRKTKNFMSQFRAPAKSIGTYFKIKMKDACTQYSPPTTTEDTAADSTCLPLDDDLNSSQNVNASKETCRNHSLLILQSLRKQQESGMLCDITLSAQDQTFKAHKVILASCSEFFHTLFTSDPISQSALSFIELQGITASALRRVLEYIYTSEVSVDGNVKSVHEIISAAKRLKINSLFSVCSILEEALASEQDLSGWVISNKQLLAPNTDLPQEAVVSNSGSLILPSSEERMDYQLPGSDQLNRDDSDQSRSSPESKVHIQEESASPTSLTNARKAPKRSLSEVKEETKPKTRKRRDRGASLTIEATANKQLKSDESVKSHPCPYCKRSFWKKRSLLSHVEKTHPDEEKDEPDESAPKCKIKKIENPAVVLRGAHRCEVCSRNFKNATALSSHVRNLHRDTARRKRDSRDRNKNEMEADGNTSMSLTGSSDQKDPSIPPFSEEESKVKDMEESPPDETVFSSKTEQSTTLTDDPSNVKLKLFQCDICEEIFSVECFYKAHMAGHKLNGDMA